MCGAAAEFEGQEDKNDQYRDLDPSQRRAAKNKEAQRRFRNRQKVLWSCTGNFRLVPFTPGTAQWPSEIAGSVTNAGDSAGTDNS